MSSSVHCMDDRCFCKANHGFEGSRGRSSDLRRGWGVGVGGVAPTYGLIDMCGALYQNLVQTKESPWPGTRASAWVIIDRKSFVSGTSVSLRGDVCGSRIIKKKQ